MSNAIGLLGVFLLLLAYFLLIRGRWQPLDLAYPVTNCIASLCLIYSLIFDFNLSAMIVNIMFLLIGLYGAWKALRRRKVRAYVRMMLYENSIVGQFFGLD